MNGLAGDDRSKVPNGQILGPESDANPQIDFSLTEPGICVPWYMRIIRRPQLMAEIERVQTGVRIERHLLKVLKALAELKTLGDLPEDIVLHAFEGKTPFSKETLNRSQS